MRYPGDHYRCRCRDRGSNGSLNQRFARRVFVKRLTIVLIVQRVLQYRTQEGNTCFNGTNLLLFRNARQFLAEDRDATTNRRRKGAANYLSRNNIKGATNGGERYRPDVVAQATSKN